jgi:hypothetical protein
MWLEKRARKLGATSKRLDQSPVFGKEIGYQCPHKMEKETGKRLK